MKLNTDLWAIVKPDGTVAGDGESPCLYSLRDLAMADLYNAHIIAINGGHLRLVRVRLVEQEGSSDGR